MDKHLDDQRNLFYSHYMSLIGYAENTLGYTVIEGSDCVDSCKSDSKVIEIYSLNGVENRLYALLHECGHALIRKNWTKFKSQYPAHADHDGDGRKESNSFKISTLEEEIEAWKRGWSLSERLNLSLNKESYNKHKNKHLMTYIKWAAS